MNRVTYLTAILGIFALAILTAGCQNSQDTKPDGNAANTPAADGDAHAHATEGPHHGHLIELGQEEYHAELTHDEKTHKVTVYLLDGAAKSSVATESQELSINLVVEGRPVQFTLPAAPLASDPPGQTSRFELVDETLCDAWDVPQVKGRLNVSIDGNVFSGTIEHDEHGQHDDH